MTLRFKRNYPLVLMLVGILAALALTMGSQPIVSYTVNADSLQTVQSIALADLTQLTASFSAQSMNTDLTINPIQP